MKQIENISFYNISLRATLKETFTAKYNGVLPRTPQARPKSEIYCTPKWDDEHPRPFHMGVPPPRVVYLSANLRLIFLTRINTKIAYKETTNG